MRSILAPLRKHSLMPALVLLQVALACAILCNVLFLAWQRLQPMLAPSGVDADNLILVDNLAAQGRTYLNPELGARLAAEPPMPDRPPDDLSARELEVLRLVAMALSNAQIAARLHISSGTVKRHLTNIYGKLNAVSRVDAIKKATEANLIGGIQP